MLDNSYIKKFIIVYVFHKNATEDIAVYVHGCICEVNLNHVWILDNLVLTVPTFHSTITVDPSTSRSMRFHTSVAHNIIVLYGFVRGVVPII